MAKLCALTAVLSGTVLLLAADRASACPERDRCRHHAEDTADRDDDEDADADDDVDEGKVADTDDDNDGDDDSDSSGPGFHIRITGPIRGTRVAEPPEPPEPPPPPRARRTVRVERVATAFSEARPAPEPDFGGTTRVTSSADPSERRIGVGLRASTLHLNRGGPDAASVGVLLRFRARPVELELDIGRDEYLGDASRSDTRLGASLYVPLASGRVVPFLVAGTGLNFSYFKSTGDQLHQGYLSGGGGLAIECTRRFAIDLDARYMLRQFFDSNALVAAQPESSGGGANDRDQALEVRLSGVVYF